MEAIEDGLAIGVEDDGRLVAFLYASVVGDAAFVEEVSVHTAAAGRRLGAQLIDHLECAAAELGLSRLVLTTFAEVPWNAPYYARLGFDHGAGSLGATLLATEVTRGFDEAQRVAMQRPVSPGDGDRTELFETLQADSATFARLRLLMDEAFPGAFSEHDWAHALGGLHAVVRRDGEIVAHASGVPRTLYVGASAWDAGYVEAVAVTPALQRQGLGTRVTRALQVRLRARYDVLALSSSSGSFYARMGWAPWQGPTFTMRDGAVEWTPDDDGGIHVLAGLRALPNAQGPLGCDARPGEVW